MKLFSVIALWLALFSVSLVADTTSKDGVTISATTVIDGQAGGSLDGVAVGGGGGFNQTGLVLWLDLAGDANDDSGNHTVTPVGAPGYVTGPFSDANGAIQFSTTPDQYLTVPDSDDFSPSGDYSIVYWGFGDGSGTNYYFSKYNPSGDRSFYFYWDSGGVIAHARTNDGTTMELQNTASSAFPHSAWTHIALVYTGSTNTIEYFKDGVSAGTDTYASETGALHNGTSILYVGSLDGSNSAVAKMARLSFWGRALGSAEVSTLHNGGADVKFADLPSL